MKKVVVTGGAGFIGSHVVEECLNQGYHVSVIDNLSTGNYENIAGLPIDFYLVDITDPTVMNLITSLEPDYVIHLAAQVSVAQSVQNLLFDEKVNVTGSLHVIKGAVAAGAKRIVFSSSAAVYGNPLALPVTTEHPTFPESPYGLTKLTVENYLKMFYKLYGLSYSILRFSNVYGPRQDARGEGGVISIFADLMCQNKQPIIYGDGEQTRDFIYVKDVASAVAQSMIIDGNICVNISTETSISIRQLYHTMKALMGIELNPVYEPERPGDIRESILANKATKALLNWQPNTDLYKGLENTLVASYQGLTQVKG